jgi:hypothetical protein
LLPRVFEIRFVTLRRFAARLRWPDGVAALLATFARRGAALVSSFIGLFSTFRAPLRVTSNRLILSLRRHLLLPPSPALPLSFSAVHALLAARLITLTGQLLSAAAGRLAAWSSFLIVGDRIPPGTRRLVALSQLARFTGTVVRRLILTGAAGAFSRRLLAAAFLTAAGSVASLLALRIAFLFAARTRRRLLFVRLLALRALLLALFTRLHLWLRIWRALAIFFMAGTRLALRGGRRAALIALVI